MNRTYLKIIQIQFLNEFKPSLTGNDTLVWSSTLCDIHLRQEFLYDVDGINMVAYWRRHQIFHALKNILEKNVLLESSEMNKKTDFNTNLSKKNSHNFSQGKFSMGEFFLCWMGVRNIPWGTFFSEKKGVVHININAYCMNSVNHKFSPNLIRFKLFCNWILSIPNLCWSFF